MRRAAALPFVLGAFLACATSKTGELEPRYVAVHNAMAAMGLAQVGPIQQGSLAEGRETRLRIDLGAQCTTIVALGGTGVRDLDVALLDADDKPVAHDTTKDAQAALRTCPDRAGKFTLVVKMAQGGGDFLAATWAGGTSGVGAPATGDAGAMVGTGTGTCDSPIVLGPGTINGNTRHGESEHAGSCASSSSSEIVYLLDVQRRQRVVIDVDATFDSVLYLRRENCADEEAEIACNDDANPNGPGNKRSSSNRTSRLDEVLEPGKYFVFVDGYNTDAGAYRLKAEMTDVPSLADVCRTARPLSVGKISSQLGNAFDNAHASCGDDAKGPDVVHRFDVATRSRVRITSTSSDFSPVVHVRKQCADDKTEVGCEGSGFGSGEATFVGFLDPNSYTVFADSSDKEARGRFTLEAETAPENGSGVPNDACADALPLALIEKRIEGDTFRARDDVGGKCATKGMPDVVYRFELPRRSRVTAHFVSQEGAHVLVLAKTCGDPTSELACSSNVDEVLAPGIYSLAVDGTSEEGLGRYAFTFAARDVSAQENACKAPPVIAPGSKTTGTTAGAGDKFMASCAGREEVQASADRVFRIDLKQRTRIQLLLSTPTHDGVLALRKSCIDPPRQRAPRAAEVTCNDNFQDNRHSRIESTLEAGTYFVVVEGQAGKNEGPFTLEYKHLADATPPAKPPPPKPPAPKPRP
jgi:hypothetical protein